MVRIASTQAVTLIRRPTSSRMEAYWFNDGDPNPGHSSLTGGDAVTWTIYAGTSKSSKLKRDDDEIGAVGLVAREAVDSEVLEVRSHAAHKARAHARGLRNLVGAHKA